MRASLPEITWTPVYIRNPDRRWWQWRKPRRLLNPDLPPLFEPNDILFEGIIWKEVK